jgi:hypothetical protein
MAGLERGHQASWETREAQREIWGGWGALRHKTRCFEDMLKFGTLPERLEAGVDSVGAWTPILSLSAADTATNIRNARFIVPRITIELKDNRTYFQWG